MKWLKPEDKDIKIRKKFAILPVEINREVRWLEWVTIKYQFFDDKIIKHKDKYYRMIGWLPIEFIDEDTRLE